MKFLVTAGPTREFYDPVRFFSNPSSGKMGFAIARAASERGHDVLLIAGPTHLKAAERVTRIDIVSARDMYREVMEHKTGIDVIIMAAAVADYRPENRSSQKMKKGGGPITIILERNPDILQELGERKSAVLFGFAAETQDCIGNARKKLREKNLDYIAVNNVLDKNAGFDSDTNIVTLLDRRGNVTEFPLLDKTDLAEKIVILCEKEAVGKEKG